MGHSSANSTEDVPYRSLSAIFAEREAARDPVRKFPKIRDGYAIFYMAITTFITATAGIIPFVLVLIFYILWLPQILYKGTFIIRPTRDTVFCWLMAFLCCLSALWSDYRSNTLHAALEFASTMPCAIIIARIVTTRALIAGIAAGTVLVLAASLISHNYGVDPFTGEITFVGLFGSKNQLGLFAETGIVFSLAGLCMKQRLSKKFWYFLPLAMGLALLYLSRSATSMISLMVTMAAVCMVYLIVKMPRSFRTPAFFSAALLLMVITAAGAAMEWQDTIFKSFGKDSTLSGRTMLWDEGFRFGMQQPFFGCGYAAFWIDGRPLAEKLWYTFGVHGGFHFHNLFMEYFIELGVIGAGILAILLLTNLLKTMRLILRHGMILEYVLPFSLTVMFIVRAMTEVDIAQYSIAALLMFGVIPRLAAYKQEHAAS